MVHRLDVGADEDHRLHGRVQDRGGVGDAGGQRAGVRGALDHGEEGDQLVGPARRVVAVRQVAGDFDVDGLLVPQGRSLSRISY